MMMMRSRRVNKRKELEQVYNDDFSTDFPLSSPATKIRRLDADLAPIIEEDEPLMVFEQTMYPPVGAAGAASTTATLVEMIPKIEELPPQENEERALVLFKPMDNTPFLHSPASFSVTSDILAGLKNQAPWSNGSKLPQPMEDKGQGQEDEVVLARSNQCLAVVPWVQPPTLVEQPVTQMMEGEGMDTASMDIEDNYTAIEQTPSTQFGGTSSIEPGLHQWQQQHCMVPPQLLPQNPSQPIVWFQ